MFLWTEVIPVCKSIVLYPWTRIPLIMDLSTVMIKFNEIFYQNTGSLWDFSGVRHAYSTITFLSDIMSHIAVYQHWYTLWYFGEDEMFRSRNFEFQTQLHSLIWGSRLFLTKPWDFASCIRIPVIKIFCSIDSHNITTIENIQVKLR